MIPHSSGGVGERHRRVETDKGWGVVMGISLMFAARFLKRKEQLLLFFGLLCAVASTERWSLGDAVRTMLIGGIGEEW